MVTYYATCRICGQEETFADYSERGMWVGEHRVKTGHAVVAYQTGRSALA